MADTIKKLTRQWDRNTVSDFRPTPVVGTAHFNIVNTGLLTGAFWR